MATACGPLLELLQALPCELCQEQPVERRLLMEIGALRSARALRRAMADVDAAARVALQEDLDLAEAVLRQLGEHRMHTPFFKVVARDSSGDTESFLSVFDGTTRYKLGLPSFDPLGGVFVHATEEAAAQSVESFPRSSAAWAVPRAILLVRGEGAMRLRHGKILFDGITPLLELPAKDSRREVLRAPWRF